jgi:hypothetical protein
MSTLWDGPWALLLDCASLRRSRRDHFANIIQRLPQVLHFYRNLPAEDLFPSTEFELLPALIHAVDNRNLLMMLRKRRRDTGCTVLQWIMQSDKLYRCLLRRHPLSLREHDPMEIYRFNVDPLDGDTSPNVFLPRNKVARALRIVRHFFLEVLESDRPLLQKLLSCSKTREFLDNKDTSANLVASIVRSRHEAGILFLIEYAHLFPVTDPPTVPN